jgi:hypothetical protein
VRNYLVTLNNWALLPNSTIYRRNKKFDFYADETAVPQIIKEKLVELKEDATVIFKKAGETTKLSADLKKEGRAISKNGDKLARGKR